MKQEILLLIKQSIQNIDERYRESFLKFLIQLESSKPLIFDRLLKVLQEKVQLSSVNNHPTIATYMINLKTIIFDNECLKKTQENEPIVMRYLPKVINHEVTHALDNLDRENSAGLSRLMERSLKLNDMTNALFNVLNCIRTNNRVNKVALRKISQIIEVDNKISGEIISSASHEVFEKNWRLLLNMYGSVPTGKGSYITQAYPHGKNYLTIVTFDLNEVMNSLQKTTDIRKVNNLHEGEALFLGLIDKKHLPFWQSLSIRQRKTLDKLMMIAVRIENNVKRDDTCYPDFTRCIADKVNDCFQTYMSCLASTSKDPSYSNILESTLEVPAAYYELECRVPPSKEMVESLCSLSNTKSSVESAKKELPVISNIIKEKESPAILGTNNESKKTQGEKGYLETFSYSFLTGVSGAIIDKLVESLNMSPWKKYIFKHAANLALTVLLGSPITEALILKISLIIVNLTSKIFGLDKMKLLGVQFDIADLLFISSQITDIEKIGPTAFSFFSAGLGFFAGNKLIEAGKSIFKNEIPAEQNRVLN